MNCTLQQLQRRKGEKEESYGIQAGMEIGGEYNINTNTGNIL